MDASMLPVGAREGILFAFFLQIMCKENFFETALLLDLSCCRFKREINRCSQQKAVIIAIIDIDRCLRNVFNLDYGISLRKAA